MENRYHDCNVEPEPKPGTYGLIWFLNRKLADTVPRTFAVKTIAPETLKVPTSAKDVEYLQREFRIWLGLPSNYNVLTALGFDVATLSDRDGSGVVSLPVMRMGRMSGSLDDWIDGRINPSAADRLIASAQAFNGLAFLYMNGIQGHGDLKPSNILYSNLSVSFELPAGGWPSPVHPWLIKIADLGWADAWVDLGFTKKALRQYLAPERLDGRVVPAKSDVFAMSIIAAELLQGYHPANLKRIAKSEGEWRRWIERGKWDIGGVAFPSVRALIMQCLDVDPSSRPTPEECIEVLCREIEVHYGVDIGATLRLWREPKSAIEEIEHSALAAIRSLGLGPSQAMESRRDLEQRIADIRVVDFDSCEAWVVLADALRQILEEERPVPSLALAQVKATAKQHLESVIAKIDPRAPGGSVRKRDDWPASLQPFERFAGVVGAIADIAEITYESADGGTVPIGKLALSAFAFSRASAVKSVEGDGMAEELFLSESIRHAPDIAVPYYFRASWGHGRWLVRSMLDGGPSKPTIAVAAGWIRDLETAHQLAPEWAEPAELLSRLRTP